jgi:hypothetical protein
MIYIYIYMIHGESNHIVLPHTTRVQPKRVQMLVNSKRNDTLDIFIYIYIAQMSSVLCLSGWLYVSFDWTKR